MTRLYRSCQQVWITSREWRHEGCWRFCLHLKKLFPSFCLFFLVSFLLLKNVWKRNKNHGKSYRAIGLVVMIDECVHTVSPVIVSGTVLRDELFFLFDRLTVGCRFQVDTRPTIYNLFLLYERTYHHVSPPVCRRLCGCAWTSRR